MFDVLTSFRKKINGEMTPYTGRRRHVSREEAWDYVQKCLHVFSCQEIEVLKEHENFKYELVYHMVRENGTWVRKK